MLRDFAEKYFFDQNYNCAETVLHAANEYYKLDLPERDMKLVSGFGAGIQTGSTCGALLAAVSVFSLKYVETKAHESTDIKPAVSLLTQRFQEALNNSTLCCDIRPAYFKPEVRCLHVVLTACDVIEQVMAEYTGSL